MTTPEPTPATPPPARRPWYRHPYLIPVLLGIMVALTIAVIVVALSTDDEDEPAPLAPVPAVTVTVSPTPSFAVFAKVTRADVAKTEFVDRFRKDFPALADKRSNAFIADAGMHACNILFEDDITRAGIIRRTALDLKNGVDPTSEATVLAVIKLAVDTSCTTRGEAYAHQLG